MKIYLQNYFCPITVVVGKLNSHLEMLSIKKMNSWIEIARARAIDGIFRGRSGSCSKPGTKACREKLRREKLNERFLDLNSVLEPGRPAKTDKSAILDDAIRVLTQLRTEAQELEETNGKLLEEIKFLKAEKNKIREQKLVLKANKERIEQQLKTLTVSAARYLPAHPAGYHGAATKMAVFPGYGLVPMWPYLPQSVRDTSRDHELRPPAA